MVNCQNNTATTQKAFESYIAEILETLQTTKMCEGYSKLTFFVNDNSFGHLRKLSSHFVGRLKLSKIQGQKRKW